MYGAPLCASYSWPDVIVSDTSVYTGSSCDDFFSTAIVAPDGMACFLGQLSELKARYDAKENKYRSQRDLLARQVQEQ